MVAQTSDEPFGALAIVPPLVDPAGVPPIPVQVSPPSVDVEPSGFAPHSPSVTRTTVEGVFCSKSMEVGVAEGLGDGFFCW